MGRIDAPPSRGLAPRASWGFWKIASGVLAGVVLMFGAYEFGSRRPRAVSVPAAAVPTVAIAETRPLPTDAVPAEEPTAEPGRIERSVMVVTLPRPSPAAPPGEVAGAVVDQAAKEPPEGLHEKMVRCLSFRAEKDELETPGSTQVRVTALNACDLAFAGSDVWVEVRAIPLSGGGTAAREVGRFQAPILPRGRSETLLALACAGCDRHSHRFEGRLWWASGGGRTE